MNPRIPHHKAVMFLRASIISESEVSITTICLPCSPCYTAVQIKNCSNSTSVIKVATMQKYDGTACSSYHLKLKYSFPFPVSIKNCLKSTSAIEVATMKNMDDFRYAKEAIM